MNGRMFTSIFTSYRELFNSNHMNSCRGVFRTEDLVRRQPLSFQYAIEQQFVQIAQRTRSKYLGSASRGSVTRDYSEG